VIIGPALRSSTFIFRPSLDISTEYPIKSPLGLLVASATDSNDSDKTIAMNIDLFINISFNIKNYYINF
jgi:hypothetical protein